MPEKLFPCTAASTLTFIEKGFWKLSFSLAKIGNAIASQHNQHLKPTPYGTVVQ
ncbi:hypothetical protein H6S82_05880 [Planktothrix sp. FACHB-1355]|uniref:hypothetical protein n=1 Tax=Oscillatoriophycideae TaxID=1301283 RepID=UPI0016836C18|nr:MULTISPECIES: hypothetical protein [Oscillatoriales]MBD3558387.1 hypothetical protein [Planktothrix sp. FACHB-1355]